MYQSKQKARAEAKEKADVDFTVDESCFDELSDFLMADEENNKNH